VSFKNAKRHEGVADPLVYHAPQTVKRGDPAFVMTSTQLRAFAQCPDKWINGFEFAGSKSTDFGSLLDCRLLTPQLFDQRYVVKPETYTNEDGEVKPWNGNSKTCKAWIADHDGFEFVTVEQLAEVDLAISRLNSKPTIKAFLESCDRQVLCTAEWHDKKTGLVIPVKCLLDLVPRVDTEFAGNLGDLKSTRSAALIAFSMDCFKMGYHVQSAFYRDIYVTATGEDRNTCVYILCENMSTRSSRASGSLSQDFYTLGHASYVLMLENYCQCLKSNQWPDYEQNDEAVGDWNLVNASPFMAERAAFAPRFNFDGKTETEAAEIGDENDIPTP
jgi:hypothetical protein